MHVRGPRDAGGVALALVVLAGDVAGAVLLAAAVPYLSPVAVWLAPLVGGTYAVAAALIALGAVILWIVLRRPRRREVVEEEELDTYA